MNTHDPDLRLNQIATLWTLVRQAHDEPGGQAQEARQALLNRYLGAIGRYLRGALRDSEAAADLVQDFAYRFLHGDLRGVDPGRGRFRDYVKGVLFHLVVDHHKRRKQEPALLAEDLPEPGADCPLAAEREEAFRLSWRDELLARTWEALEEQEQQGGSPLFSVLRFRADNPDLSSQQIAEQLGAAKGRELTAANVRKLIERARVRFGDLLLDEIAQAMENPTREQLEEELADLELLEHCREALARRPD